MNGLCFEMHGIMRSVYFFAKVLLKISSTKIIFFQFSGCQWPSWWWWCVNLLFTCSATPFLQLLSWKEFCGSS